MICVLSLASVSLMKHGYSSGCVRTALLVLRGRVTCAISILGLPPLPALPPRNLPGITPLPMPAELLSSFPLVPEGSSAASAGELLSSLPPTSSLPSDPIMTTAMAGEATSLTVDAASPAPRAPTSMEDRAGASTPASERPASAVTDASAAESP